MTEGPNGISLENFNRDHIGVHSYINLALGVHSHLVPTRNECTPIWSLLLFEVHSNVVLNNFWGAQCTVHSHLVLISDESSLSKMHSKVVLLYKICWSWSNSVLRPEPDCSVRNQSV